MTDSELKTDVLPQRLCSEIQLFDLCDLVSCNHKNGRFCTDPIKLDSFESVDEHDHSSADRLPERMYDEDSEDEEGVNPLLKHLMDMDDGALYSSLTKKRKKPRVQSLQQDEELSINNEDGENDDYEDEG